MRTYTNPYSQKIYLIITPLIGDLMAAGVLKTQTQKLGITEEQLTSRHLPQLAEGIRQGLNLFLGTEVASQVAKKITEIK
jgi:hypothetical protein